MLVLPLHLSSIRFHHHLHPHHPLISYFLLIHFLIYYLFHSDYCFSQKTSHNYRYYSSYCYSTNLPAFFPNPLSLGFLNATDEILAFLASFHYCLARNRCLVVSLTSAAGNVKSHNEYPEYAAWAFFSWTLQLATSVAVPWLLKNGSSSFLALHLAP